MQYDILTIFPNAFVSYCNESILKRAQDGKHVSIRIHDIRRFTTDKHRTVDDRPYGGGPGMVMKPEPIYRCLNAIKRKKKSRTILLSARGKTYTQRIAKRLAKYDQLLFICGHYEGVDERISKYADEQISIGNYVLTGGELPALVIIDSVTRLLPGVLGDPRSTHDESFSPCDTYREYPQYTRPEVFNGMRVPRILLSGNHSKIASWKRTKSRT
ncbi:MAG: tRNA (guanosine(37)-N1)-methyltransferase TrmD [Patescibacteria group bacterium]|nr:tRNA (guanosine(37)-N1)-methyltransferase TrmD [Patescibacteria group bacterium]